MSRVTDLAQGLIRVTDEKAASRADTEPRLFETPTTARGKRVANRNARRHGEAYGGDDAIGAVMDCVDLYAQTASNAAFHFERPNGRRLRDPGEATSPGTIGEVPADLHALLDRPNRMMDYTDLIELSIIDFLLTGEFFWYKHETDPLGKPKELYRISPACMEVLPGPTAPKGYEYRPPGSGETLTFSPSEIVHVKRPNPHDPWRGLGIIAGDPRMYDIALAATESMAQYYEQGTRLSGVLESERSIPPNTFAKLKAQFMALYQGKANHGKVAMLERGLKFKPISGDANQADYTGSRKLTREEIAAAFKVPLPLLGQVGGSDRQAVKEGQRIFDNKIMRPFLNRLARQVTRQLIEDAWSLNWVIDHEYIMPIEDKIDLAQALASVPGVRVREVRALVDFEPLATDDPDLEWIDEAILNLPGKDREEGGHPDQPLTRGGEGGRPPKGQNTVLFPRDERNVPGSADIVTSGAAQKAIQAAREALDGANREE